VRSLLQQVHRSGALVGLLGRDHSFAAFRRKQSITTRSVCSLWLANRAAARFLCLALWL